jgi:hypothetical protein
VLLSTATTLATDTAAIKTPEKLPPEPTRSQLEPPIEPMAAPSRSDAPNVTATSSEWVSHHGPEGSGGIGVGGGGCG